MMMASANRAYWARVPTTTGRFPGSAHNLYRKLKRPSSIPPADRSPLVKSRRSDALRSQPSAKKRVLLWVCGAMESVADLLHRLNVALGRAAAENVVIDEVLPEIQRRR